MKRITIGLMSIMLAALLISCSDETRTTVTIKPTTTALANTTPTATNVIAATTNALINTTAPAPTATVPPVATPTSFATTAAVRPTATAQGGNALVITSPTLTVQTATENGITFPLPQNVTRVGVSNTIQQSLAGYFADRLDFKGIEVYSSSLSPQDAASRYAQLFVDTGWKTPPNSTATTKAYGKGKFVGLFTKDGKDIIFRVSPAPDFPDEDEDKVPPGEKEGVYQQVKDKGAVIVILPGVGIVDALLKASPNLAP